MLQVNKNEIVFTTSFVIGNNQSAKFDVADFPDFKFEVQVQDKPNNITGMPADEWINKRFENQLVTFSMGFIGDNKGHSTEVDRFLTYGQRHLSVQIVRQAVGKLMLVTIYIFSEQRP